MASSAAARGDAGRLCGWGGRETMNWRGYDSQPDEEGPQVCEICRHTEFTLTAGFWTCNNCGTQAELQQTQNEQVHQTGLRPTVRRVRTQSQSQRRQSQPPLYQGPRPVASVAEKVDSLGAVEKEVVSHLAGIQKLLSRQSTALTSLYHCHGLLQFVKQIWNRLLALNEDVLKFEEVLEAKEESALEELRHLRKVIVETFPVEKTIPILMLAILIKGEPIMPIDLTRSIVMAKVPLFKDEQHTPIIGITSHALLDASKLAEKLLIPFPKINIGGLTQRFLRELNLPEDMARQIHRLHQFLPQEVDKYFEISTRKYSLCVNPYPYVLALIVVALKLQYGLDGRMMGVDRSEGKGGPAPAHAHAWTSWAKELVQSKEAELSPWLSESIPKNEICNYANFLNSHIFSEDFAQKHDYFAPMARKLKEVVRQQEEFSGSNTDANARSNTASQRRDSEEGPQRHADGSANASQSGRQATAQYVLYEESCSTFHLDYQAVVIALAFTFWMKPKHLHHAGKRNCI